MLAGEAIDAEHLDHGHALIVHRPQGAYDRAHVLATGAVRELAYVALSRARTHTTLHTSPTTSSKPPRPRPGSGARRYST